MKKRWNWIDTTITIIIILAVVAFLNRGKIINKSKEVVTAGGKNIIITAEASELTKEMITDLKVGDQMFSQNNLQKGFVEEIDINPKIQSVVGEDGKIVTYEDAEEITVTVKIKAEVASSGPYMDLGGQEIKVGLPIILKTTTVEFPGTIKYIEVK
ncbi:DUF4330 family protein [Tissierella praeacuta]|uniref:DUF4330 domain-containing protein n=1 Tax=Tissierella praeacuta DSM 18095 TaxID=1123404 RepID=A0A1M4V868_9FIRM|nr:DUF4330 family protein [Tissierella praeacuta]MBU5255025.1 DUF4330 domain-containing protein [Tissierella praeacuta]TCU74126.1 uncharacterized protein DUF4330 [Tissierella praeacuta]SHE65080.1 protein of unknown function [Tissierella praeacuta DSM 18095]SUP03008.1 Uncharacterised protein [Tissierella praeacuta]